MPIVLFTDFGADLYVGQVKAVVLEHAPHVPVIDLLHDAPAFDVAAGAHLLAACLSRFPLRCVFLAVVDPGVGTGRDAVIVECDGRFLVGPDNGLLSVCAARAQSPRFWSIKRTHERVSHSFHGRDLFAPVAARVAAGDWPGDRVLAKPALDVSFGADDAPAVIYIDRYGNACTGLRAAHVMPGSTVTVGGRSVPYADVFAAAPPGVVFWYENSLGLVEIAANRAAACRLLDLAVGQPVSIG
jgi:S-adenosyl-L-methionine hydrolase (adenosine-forming)